MRIRDPGWRQFGSGIRDGKKSDPGSGINIPDPQHCLNLCILLCFLKVFKLNTIFYSVMCVMKQIQNIQKS
jgi:hypothetical protein